MSKKCFFISLGISPNILRVILLLFAEINCNNNKPKGVEGINRIKRSGIGLQIPAKHYTYPSKFEHKHKHAHSRCTYIQKTSITRLVNTLCDWWLLSLAFILDLWDLYLTQPPPPDKIYQRTPPWHYLLPGNHECLNRDTSFTSKNSIKLPSPSHTELNHVFLFLFSISLSQYVL